MRLWHYDLIEYLPKQQLLGQWRELNSIYVKQDKHILINFIYEYEKAADEEKRKKDEQMLKELKEILKREKKNEKKHFEE